MKEKILKKIVIIVLLVIQLLQLGGSFLYSKATIKEGDVVNLKADHKCDYLLRYWSDEYQVWSYKEIWYVYYEDKENLNRYPAFCVEPSKKGVGIDYTSYDALIKDEKNDIIWRILNKGYMGSNYQDWNLECDDDLYSATKVAVHSIVQQIAPKDKYILGSTSIDGNTVEEIVRRGEKVLNVAQNLYEYGLNGKETYESPKIDIVKQEIEKEEKIGDTVYYTQKYKVNSNKSLKSYEVEIQNFPKGTKILNMKNEEQFKMSSNLFKIAIPKKEIKQDIKGNININNAYIKTNPIFYCQSLLENAQSYVTYTTQDEIATASTILEIKANKCNLQIEKIDKETKEPISNVTFEILDENRNKITEVTTNEKGIATISNLYPKTFIIKEVKVPDKYILSNEEKKVKLELNETSKVVFENEKKKGEIEVYKLDKDNNKIKLENVEFEILDKNNKVVEKIVTNKDGYAKSSKLPIGEYYIKEIKTNDKYILDEEKVKVEIEYGKVKLLKLENEKIKGKIQILKVSEDDNLINGNKKGMPIEGVEFEIRKENGEVIEKIVTDKDGIAITSKLEIGIYTIKETKAHKDYLISDKEYKVEILENEKIEEITIANTSKKPEEPKLPRTGF